MDKSPKSADQDIQHKKDQIAKLVNFKTIKKKFVTVTLNVHVYILSM